MVDPTFEPTLTHAPVPCPTTSPITVIEFVYADRSCFGGADVEIRAWLDTPQVMGWLPPVVKPGWLFYPPDARYTALFDAPPMDPEHICAVDVPECTWFFGHLQPDSGIVLEGPARWVIATGHRDDPAAERCHYVESSVAPGPYDDAPAREACRDHFVLVAIEDAPAP